MPDIQKLNVKGTDFDIDDPNDVATDGGELLDTVINYESATTPTIGSFTAFLNQFVSGTKVGQWFKNFRAGCDFILHIGSIVNNCVTDNEALPLSAAQGKVLMDELTQVKSDLTELLLVQKYVYRVTIEANTYSSLENDISLSGYTPLGVIGHATNDYNAVFYRACLEETVLKTGIRNLSSTAITFELTGCILYKKNS